MIALGVVAGGIFVVAPGAVATTTDGDVVLSAQPDLSSCTPGTDANCESTSTIIADTAAFGSALIGVSNGNQAGLEGDNFGVGPGVWGAGGPIGVQGQGTTYGVQGIGIGGIGVYGESQGGGDAVVGQLSSASTGANGVTGDAENEHNGVNAESNSPYTIGQSGHFNAALFAQNTSTGTALWARNLNNGGEGAFIEAWGAKSTALKLCGCNGATALNVSGPTQLSSLNVSGQATLSSLNVSGRLRLSRSGVATVAGTSSAPKDSVNVSVSPITSNSIMTATLQKYVAGVFVVAAVPNVSGGYFTIYLNKAVTTSVGPIAWEVTEHS